MLKPSLKGKIRKQRTSAIVEPLEPRILFSADIVSFSTDDAAVPASDIAARNWLDSFGLQHSNVSDAWTPATGTTDSPTGTNPTTTNLQNDTTNHEASHNGVGADTQTLDNDRHLTSEQDNNTATQPSDYRQSLEHSYQHQGTQSAIGNEEITRWHNLYSVDDNPTVIAADHWQFNTASGSTTTGTQTLLSATTPGWSVPSTIVETNTRYEPINSSAAYDVHTKEYTAAFTYSTKDPTPNTTLAENTTAIQATSDANDKVESETSPNNLITEYFPPGAPSFNQHQPLQVIFVDAGVDDARTLINGIQTPDNHQTQWLVVQLDSTQDGVSQITDTLAQTSHVDAIHILSHSDGKGIQLGNGWLAHDTATAYSSDISAWGQALDADADILIYGCDLASSDEGRALLQFISTYSDSDVAASDDATGHTSVGGDWELEFTQGDVTTNIPFDAAAQNSWQHKLATASFQDNTEDTYVTNVTNTAKGSSFGGETRVQVERDITPSPLTTDDITHGLLKFDIFGTGANQLPFGTTITSASFSVYVADTDNNDQIRIHDMLLGWSELSKWNDFSGNGIEPNNTEASAAPIISFNGGQAGWLPDIDITATAQGWSSGSPNNGFAILTDGATGLLPGANVWSFVSADDTANSALRPILNLTYESNPPQIDLDLNDSSGSTGSNYNTAFTEGATSIPVVDSDATITDPDSTHLSSMTVKLTNPINGADEALSVDLTGKLITASYSPGQIILTAGSATGDPKGDFEDVLRTVTYTNNNDDADLTPRTIEVTVNDGTDDSNVAISTITLNAVNDNPVTNNSLPSDINSIEDTTTTFDLSSIDLFDADIGSAPLVVTLTTSANGILNAASSTGISIQGDNTSGLSLTGTINDLNAYLNQPTNLQYTGALNNNGNDADIIEVSANDNGNSGSGGGTPVVLGTVKVDISPVNDRPVMNTAGSPQLTEILQDFTTSTGDPVATIIASAGSDPITDIDAAAVEGIAVTNVNNSNGDWQYSFDGGTSWASFGTVTNNASVVLSDTGNDHIRFVPDPGYIGVADFSYKAWDRSDLSASGSNSIDTSATNAFSMSTESASITVQPVLTNTDSPINFAEDSAPTVIDNTIFVSTSNNLTLANGTLNVTITSGSTVYDRLSVANQGTGSQQIGVSGSDITYEGNVIGSFNGGIHNTTPLNINFNAAATAASVQALMRNITFWNISDTPDTTTARDISFVLTESSTGNPYTISQSATVTATIDNPIAVDDNARLVFDEAGDYIQVNDDASLVMTNAVTLEAWVNSQPSTDPYRTIINKEGEYQVALRSDGMISWAFDNTDPDWGWHNTEYQITDNEWTHIAVSYDNGVVTTYVNGKLVDTYHGSGPIGDDNPVANTLLIGAAQTTGTSNAFSGEIDDVRIWNTARTQTEIVNNLHVALNGNEPGLAGYWNFDEGEGTVANDSTANGNDGVFSASISWTDYTTDQNTTLSIATTNGLIANDIDGDVDALSIIGVSGTTLSTSSALFNLPSGASIVVDATGAFAYNPNGTFDTLASGDIATDTFTYDISDGNGGVDTATATIRITGVNDPPQATDLDTDEAYTEDLALNLVDIIVSDVDDTDSTVTLTLSDIAAGTLNTATSGAVTSTFSGGVWSASGATSNVNNLLAGLTFTPAPNYSNDFDITTSVSDGEAPAVIGIKTITADAINDAPVITVPAAALNATEQTSIALQGTGFSVTDIDEASAGATLNLSTSSASGLITVNIGDSGTTVDSGNGTNAVVVSGTVAQIDQLLTGAGSGTISYLNTADAPATTEQLTLTVNDNGNTGDDPGLPGDPNSEQDTVNHTINITPVNDAPTNAGSVPTDVTVTEDTNSDINLSEIDIVDADAASNNLTITLATTAGGNLTGAAAPGVTVSSNTPNQITLTGTQTDLNNYLDLASNIQYLSIPDANGNDADTIEIEVTDNGNSGTVGPLTLDAGAVNVDITAVNDAPVNTVPLTQTVDEETQTAINGNSIADVDAGTGLVTTRLQATNGILNVDLSTATATISAGSNNSDDLTLQGTVSNINTVLASLRYTGNTDVIGNSADNLLITTTDNSNTGTGGSLQDSDNVLININNINDAPVITVPGVTSIDEETQAAINGISIADVDAAAGLVTTRLQVTNGILNVDLSITASSATISAGSNNSDDLTLQGTVDDINTVLASLRYTGNTDVIGNGADNLLITTTDNSNTGTGGPQQDSDSVLININNINDTPVITVPGVQTIDEDTQTAINGISIADVDAAGGLVTTRLQVNNGVLNLPSAITITTGANDSNDITLQGSVGEINTALNSLLYTGNTDINGTAADTLLITTDDGGNTGTGGPLQTSDTVLINITAVNDAPVNTVPLTQTVDEETQTAINGISIADVDAGTGLVTTRLQVTNGILNVDLSTATATISAGSNNSDDLTLQGTVSNINTVLASLRYTGNTDVTGTNADTLTATTTDNGNIGAGGVMQDIDSLQIDITPVNDKPVLSDIEIDPLAYTENDGDVPLTSSLIIGDVDNTALSSATIRISTNYNVAEDRLSYSSNGTIIGIWYKSSGTLELSGTDTLENYQTALQSITYLNNSENPDTATRTISFTVNDANNTSSTLTRDITVSRVNDAPSGTDNSITLHEDTPHVFSTSEFGFRDNLENHTFQAVEISTLPATGTLTNNNALVIPGAEITASDIDAGFLVYEPPINGNGTAFSNFDFKVRDNGGTSNTGIDLSLVSNVMTLNVTSVNDAPEGSDKVMVTAEDTALFLSSTDFGFSDAADSDTFLAVKISTLPDLGVLSLDGIDLIPGQSIPVSAITNNDLVFTPAPNTNGAPYTSLEFQVQDNGGKLNGGTDLDPSPNLLAINVTPVNDAPSGSDSLITTLEDTPYTLSIANFGFSDINDGNQIDSVVINSLPVKGTLSLDGIEITPMQSVSAIDISNGKLIFLPAANDNGINYDTFSFQVQDNGDPLISGEILDPTLNTITVNVISVNDAPIGQDNTLTSPEDTDYVLQADDFGYSDDADNNTFESVTIDTLPVHGQLRFNSEPVFENQTINVNSITAGLLVFSPEQNIHGDNYDQLQFRVSDDGGQQSSGSDTDAIANTLTFDISAVNDAPEGADNIIVLPEDSNHVFQQSDFNFSDELDGNQFIAVIIASLPNSGLLTLSGLQVESGDSISVSEIASGLLVYTPPLNAEGMGYSGFGFRVQDDGGTANQGISIDPTIRFISFDLPGINDSPQLTTTTTTVDEGSDNILTNTMLSGTDADDLLPDELTITLTTAPQNGVLTLSGSPLSAGDNVSLLDIAEDRVRYIHDGSETSSDFFDVSLADGGEDGATPATGRFSLIINEVIDPAPELTGDTLSVQFGGSFDSQSGSILNSGYSDLNKNSFLDENQYQIEIETQPLHGSVELTADGKFSYVHDGSNVLQDEFTYRVTNVDGVYTIATVSISIDPPIASAFDTKPTPAAPSKPVVPTDENEETAVRIEDTPIEFKVLEKPTPEKQDKAIAVDSVQELRLHTTKPTGTEARLEVTQHNDIQSSEYTGKLFTASVTNFEALFEVPVKRAQDVVQNSYFLDGLNRLEDDLQNADSHNTKSIQLLNNTVMGVSISALAGILSWALRGGALFASLMTATPLWASLDPTRVLAVPKSPDTPNSVDDEQVEQLFEDDQ